MDRRQYASFVLSLRLSTLGSERVMPPRLTQCGLRRRPTGPSALSLERPEWSFVRRCEAQHIGGEAAANHGLL